MGGRQGKLISYKLINAESKSSAVQLTDTLVSLPSQYHSTATMLISQHQGSLQVLYAAS